MRSKEDAHDYRYFPEPDLPPVILDSRTVRRIEDEIPELPEQKKERFLREYGLSQYETDILAGTKALADYFEEVVGFGIRPGEAANWILGELLRIRKDAENEEIPVKSRYLADLITIPEKKFLMKWLPSVKHRRTSSGKKVSLRSAIRRKRKK